MIRFLFFISLSGLAALPAHASNRDSFQKIYETSRTYTELLNKTKAGLTKEDQDFFSEKFKTLPSQKLPRAEFKKNELKLTIDGKTIVVKRDPLKPSLFSYNNRTIDLSSAKNAREVYNILLPAFSDQKTSAYLMDFWMDSAHAYAQIITGILGGVSSVVGLFYGYDTYDTRCSTIGTQGKQCTDPIRNMKRFIKFRFEPAMKKLKDRQNPSTSSEGKAFAKKFPKYPNNPTEAKCPEQLIFLHRSLQNSAQDQDNSARADELNAASDNYLALYTSFTDIKTALLSSHAELSTATKSRANAYFTPACSFEKASVDSCLNSIENLAILGCFVEELKGKSERFDPASDRVPRHEGLQPQESVDPAEIDP